MRLGLGITPVLERYANDFDCETYVSLRNEWMDVAQSWSDYLYIRMANLYFEEVIWFLDDIDDLELSIWRGGDFGLKGKITDWELHKFCSIKRWREICKFVLNGNFVSDPFERIKECCT